ncbi:MAG: branched-chain amino acid ABC transporter permease [Dehalococcoidia bacterium]
MAEFISDILIPALGIGAIYALIGISFNLIYAPGGTFNFAQGQIVMLGGLLAFTFYQEMSWPVLAALAAVLAIGGAIALAEERIAVWPALRRDPHGTGWVLSTLAVFTIIQNLAILTWGTTPENVESYPGLSVSRREVLGLEVAPFYISMLVIAVAVTYGLEIFFRRAKIGRAITAVAQDRDAAALRGVNVRWVISLGFIMGGALAAATGMLAAPFTLATVTVGLTYTFRGFTAAALGGMGSNTGALAAGLMLGLIEQLTLRYWQGGYVNFVILSVLLVLLLIRPAGLFGQAVVRRV